MFSHVIFSRLHYLTLVSFVGLLATLLAGCANMEKEITLPTSSYQRQLFVECYLEENQPYRVALTESLPYLDTVTISPINGATVKITRANGVESLKPETYIDTTYRKAYNYILDKPIVPQANEAFTLEITDSKGRKLTASTRFLPKVELKEVSWKFNEREKAYLTIRFPDDTSQSNYYRFMINRTSLSGPQETDFSFDDRFASAGEMTLGTGYEYEEDDTLLVSLYHIDKAYYDYLQSADDAASANGNPFARPSAVKSTVQGGIGVFTTLVYDRRKIIIKK